MSLIKWDGSIICCRGPCLLCLGLACVSGRRAVTLGLVTGVGMWCSLLCSRGHRRLSYHRTCRFPEFERQRASRASETERHDRKNTRMRLPMRSVHNHQDPCWQKARLLTVRHMAPTLGEPDSPEICRTNTYFKLFRLRPTCDHLVAHQPLPQSHIFPWDS